MFQLLDVVEENTSNQVRRRADDPRRREGEPGFWLWNLHDLRQLGFRMEEVPRAMRAVSAEPVLTAHPAEAKRGLLRKTRLTAELLADLALLEHSLDQTGARQWQDRFVPSRGHGTASASTWRPLDIRQ